MLIVIYGGGFSVRLSYLPVHFLRDESECKPNPQISGIFRMFLFGRAQLLAPNYLKDLMGTISSH